MELDGVGRPDDARFGRLTELVEAGSARHLDRGQALMLEADDADFVAFVLSGCFRVSTVTAAGVEVVLAICKAGEVVGEFAVFDGGARSASVWAIEPSDVRIVQGSDYLRYLEEHPRVGLDQVRALATRARESDLRRIEAVSLSVDARVALRLLELAEPTYDRVKGVTVPMVRWTQSDIASLTGVTREAVARVLGRFRDQGLVETRRGTITICDSDGLEHEACSRRPMSPASDAAS